MNTQDKNTSNGSGEEIKISEKLPENVKDVLTFSFDKAESAGDKIVKSTTDVRRIFEKETKKSIYNNDDDYMPSFYDGYVFYLERWLLNVLAALESTPPASNSQSEIAIDSRMLFWAFRYALGRRTYAVDDVATEIVRCWSLISKNDRKTIQKEIMEAVENNHAGDQCDINSWTKILKLPS